MSNPISIAQDSEFMTNLLPANPVPAGKRFVAFQDQFENPAVLALGEDSKLNLIITDNETPTLVDFGALCKFSGTILAFDIHQNADSTLYIVVASDAGNNQSNLYIVNNLSPSDLAAPPAANIFFAGGSFPVVYDIFLSNFSQTVGSTNFPMMFLSLVPPGAITKSSQLGFLDIATDGSGKFTFSLNTSWRLATDPIQIYSVTFGTCPLGQGAFVLYEASNGSHLQFQTFGGTGFVSEMQCPAGATCIDSYVNPATTYTEMLVGGDVITQFTYRQYCVGGGVGTAVVTGDASLGLKDIRVVESQSNLTIWYTTQADGVHYYSAPIASLSGGQLIQLLDDGLGGRISVMLTTEEASGALLVNTVVSADQTGHLSILQEGSDTGAWQSVPFYTPSATNNIEVPSYTLRFKAASTDPDQPVPFCQLHLTSSGAVQAFSNGVRSIIDQEGRWYQADANGVVSIIISTSDMSSFTFQVDSFQSAGKPATQVSTIVLNPNSKTNAALEKVTDGNYLLGATTQTGDHLITPGSVSQTDADNAASIIKELNKKQISVGKPTRNLKKIRRGPVFYNPHNKIPTIICGSVPKDPAELAKLVAKLSQGSWYNPISWFNWLYEKASSVVTWFVQVVGDAVSFVIELGGKIYNFLMDTVEAIGKAISWVFEKITVAVEKLIEWIGFLFKWGDILNTADSIVALLNAGLDYATDQIGNVKNYPAQWWLNNLTSAMDQRQTPMDTATGTTTQDPEDNATVDNTKNSVSYNWASYQVSYGGMGANSSMDLPSLLKDGRTDSGVTFEELWDDLKAIFTSLEDLFVQMGQNVSNIFNSSTTSDQTYSQANQQLINAAVKCAGNVANFFLDGLSLVISTIQQLGNAKIELPIFSALWDLISGGREFTVFYAFALIMAIPATLMYKVVVGSAPPSLAGLTKAQFTAYLNGTLEESELGGITRKQILMILAIAGVTAFELEIFFDLISTVTSKLSSLSAETMDTGMIIVGVVLLIVGWPVAGQKDMPYRWMIWGMDCSNVLASSIGRFAGWKLGVPREVTAPPIAVWGALNSVPSYILKIIVNIDSDGDDKSLLGRHITEDTLTMIKAWLNAIKECVPEPPVGPVAKIGGYVCTGIVIGMKMIDFYIAADPGVDVIGVTVYVRDHKNGSHKAIEQKKAYVKDVEVDDAEKPRK